MAQVYFSKFNINSEIYKVYEDSSLKSKILNEVFNKLDNDQFYDETSKELNGEEKTIRYKFCDLIKYNDDSTIIGRLVKIYPGEIQSYDAKKDTVVTKNADNCAASSTFLLDLHNEEVAFITRLGLGYNQFNTHFKILVDNLFDDFSFELMLENNIGELKRKIKNLKRIISIRSVIIPPNAGTKDFDIIFGPSADDFKKSGATKCITTLEVPKKGNASINIETDYHKKIFYAVAKGYGSMTVIGKDNNNDNARVTSELDAPYSISIPDSEKDSLIAFKERTGPGISKLIIDKQNAAENSLSGGNSIEGENK